ncbi:hypothetical protein OX459_26010 [Janthinobacterium sp. SUN026]|uniref:hypothetical protein n=1 Tax=Janthinobacterium sp. SUN026 TaxID=3002438 RepID=UPI0025B013CB|nr:hypothetical protein [Janthinobacterium sp. SUN026]MDN2674857.1 hypothetical protein [Janthinobacterium sp. SUN026]
MNNQHDIVRQEHEFQELLQKVMQEPLAPVTKSVRELDKRLDQFESLLGDLQAIIQGTNMSADDALTQIRSLKSLAEETPREIRLSLQPMLHQVQNTLEQGTVTAHRDSVEKLSGQLVQQGESGKQSFVQLQELMAQQRHELGTQAAALLMEVARLNEAELAPLVQSVAQMQLAFAEQQMQLTALAMQQEAWASTWAEQLAASTQSVRRWLIATLVVASAGCAAGIALFAGRL